MNAYNRPFPSPEPFACAALDQYTLMTDDQANLLKSLCSEAKLPFDDSLTQRDAHEQIIAMQDYIRQL